jgi:hypothetical protein
MFFSLSWIWEVGREDRVATGDVKLADDENQDLLDSSSSYTCIAHCLLVRFTSHLVVAK